MSAYRLRPWGAADAPVLLRTVTEPEIARDLPPLEHLADAKAYVGKLAGDDDLVAFAIVREAEGGDVVLGGVHRLELAHRLTNVPARSVAERAGFIPEGIMRSEVEFDGVRYDTALMSRLVTDPAPDTEPLPGLG